MKIALVTHSFFPYSVGGREKHVYDLGKALAKKGHEVEIFTCSDSFWKGYTKKENSNLKIHYFRTLKIKFSTGYYRIPLGMFFSLMFKKTDVIHAHEYFHFTTFISALVSRIKNKPFILTEHGYPELVGVLEILLKTYDKFILPLIVSSCHKIIAVSNFIKKEIVSKYKVSEEKVKVIYNGINLEEYKENNTDEKKFLEKYHLKDKKTILSMGRLIKEKGFQYLIKAIPNVKREIPEVIFVIMGPDVYFKKELMSLAKLLGVENNIIFTGPVSEKMVKGGISSSSLVVVPSIYEPFGIVALEAMAYGKPIVASNSGGLKEFLSDGNSILIEPSNELKLAEAILIILSNKELGRKIGEKAKKDIRKYDLNKLVNEILEVYEEARK